MSDAAFPASRPARRSRRRRSPGKAIAVASAVALSLAALPRFSARDPEPAAPPAAAMPAPATTPAPAAKTAEAVPAARRSGGMFDPHAALAAGALLPGRNAPLAPAFRLASVEPPAAPRVAPEPQQARPLASATVTARLAQTVPLPVRRPAEMTLRPVPETPRVASRAASARTQVAARADQEAERSFFETVFGAKPSSESALAYAATPRDGLDPAPRRSLSPSPYPQTGSGVAVYDISARRVTLPSGEVLEAHSGLGPSMDHPGYVHLRMRGATPPGTYDLTEREALFHGVRAIRLNPVGGSGAVHGRTGLLAHTYMLGPSGASNGCVSFRNYNRFLQAFLRGEVRRLVVVAGSGRDRFPAFAGAE